MGHIMADLARHIAGSCASYLFLCNNPDIAGRDVDEKLDMNLAFHQLHASILALLLATLCLYCCSTTCYSIYLILLYCLLLYASTVALLLATLYLFNLVLLLATLCLYYLLLYASNLVLLLATLCIYSISTTSYSMPLLLLYLLLYASTLALLLATRYL
ncbi:hypothetical protein CEXT_413881 [Caerostris extrusa]|uniref:Protein E5 n=1 Tax=Caerostris extrusa TaxID=172846 RepID=A0AAV4TLU9_CAEEX|nr:hypothetical protein CEXT_413881 [Caerostris extrusa]